MPYTEREKMGFEIGLSIGKETVAGTPVAPTMRFNPVSEGFYAKRPRKVETARLTGFRNKVKGQRTSGEYDVGGSFVLEGPTATELAFLIPLVCGDATGTTVGAVTTYKPQRKIPYLTIQLERAGQIFTHTGCKIGQMVIESSKGGSPIRASFNNIIGMDVPTRTVGPVGTTPSFAAADPPMLHSFLGFTARGDTFYPETFRFTYNNNLVGDFYRNSLKRLEIPESMAAYTGQVQLDPEALYYADFIDGSYVPGTGIIIVATYTDPGVGGAIWQFTFTNAVAEGDPEPKAASVNPLLATVDWEAYDTLAGANDAVAMAYTPGT